MTQQINKITRENHPDDFESLIADFEGFVTYDHRRGATFYVQALIHVDPNWWTGDTELCGYWRTNTFVWNDEQGYDERDIYELIRVNKITKTIETTEWVDVESTK